MGLLVLSTARVVWYSTDISAIVFEMIKQLSHIQATRAWEQMDAKAKNHRGTAWEASMQNVQAALDAKLSFSFLLLVQFSLCESCLKRLRNHLCFTFVRYTEFIAPLPCSDHQVKIWTLTISPLPHQIWPWRMMLLLLHAICACKEVDIKNSDMVSALLNPIDIEVRRCASI